VLLLDGGAYDLIFVMDYLNEARLLGRFPEAKHKTFLLGKCTTGQEGNLAEISDP
jgi:hypothetical protein